MANKKYIEESKNLIKVIDVAIEVFKSTPPNGFNNDQVQALIDSYKTFKRLIIDAEPRFQTIASLKYDLQNVFTYFQEASGETVNRFWQKIREARLPYERENKMEKLIKRGKIRNQIEYDYVTDTIVPLNQEGLISDTDFELLNQFIADYEIKNAQKK